MLRIGGRKVLLGGFHDHWARTNTDNPALLMAALNYYQYDFVCLMDGEGETRTKHLIESYCPHLRVFVGNEEVAEWGHLITVHPRERVVVPQGTPPAEVFARFEAANEFVAMAHPEVGDRDDHVLTYEQVGLLMDQGVIKATQLCPSAAANAWFRRRDAEGRRTPIVSGWDVHLVIPLKGLPPVLYGPERSPDGHLDSCDGHRTVVLAEENSFAAIKAAILRGESVVESVHSGELIGPAELVRFLEEHGYREAVARLNARRDACRLTVSAPAVAGERVTLRFSTPGPVRLPGAALDSPCEAQTAADGTLTTEPLPAILDRDITYLPVVKTEPDGYVRVWALELQHPVQLDVLPRLRDGRLALELRARRPFHGQYRLEIPGGGEVVGNETQMEVTPPRGGVVGRPFTVHVIAMADNGVTRRSEFLVTGVPVPRFTNDWTVVQEIDVAEDCAPPLKGQYGANRPYPGREVFSGRLQFAWSPEELLVRVRVVDAVHFQPLRGHFMYHGDSLQLALDPLLQREDGVGSVYVFNYCLGPDGPEVFRWLRPDDGLAPGYSAPPGNVSLGGRYLRVEPWDRGLVYELRLPWSELAPAKPTPGLRMGVYFLMFNNDGQGLIDTLLWPRPMRGMWLVPRRWGVLNLL